METRSFGAEGPPVAIVGQGTWKIDEASRASAITALRAGLDLGMTHIDTAEMYGEAEEIVADAIAGRRDHVFLVSKVLPGHASRTGTIVACEQSLKRLRTGWLDCYLLHWRGDHPLAETFAAFELLREVGKIRSWGVSNFDASDLAEALTVAGEGRISCNQVLYHIRERAIEHDVLPWCTAHGVAVVAYSPFGQDRFPAPNNTWRTTAHRNCPRARCDAAPGGASFPAPIRIRVRNSEGVIGGAHARKCRRGRALLDPRGDRAAGARVSAWSSAALVADDLRPRAEAASRGEATRGPRQGSERYDALTKRA